MFLEGTLITTVCQSFGAFPEGQVTWGTWISQWTPSLLAASSISERISSQLANFQPSSVLTARKTGHSGGIFLPQMQFLCVRWCESDWIQTVVEILALSVKNIILIAKYVTFLDFEGCSNVRSFAACTSSKKKIERLLSWLGFMRTAIQIVSIFFRIFVLYSNFECLSWFF